MISEGKYENFHPRIESHKILQRLIVFLGNFDPDKSPLLSCLIIMCGVFIIVIFG